MKRTYIFRSKLKEILDRKGMTQKELAELTGLRPADISEIANDIRSVLNKDRIIRIMDQLDLVDLNDLIELQVYESGELINDKSIRN